MRLPPNLCVSCVHLKRTDDYLMHTCDAFKEGIPADIYFHGGDHRVPVAGDNGIQYELIPGMSELLELWAERTINAAGPDESLRNQPPA
jgi:hypothetical protein